MRLLSISCTFFSLLIAQSSTFSFFTTSKRRITYRPTGNNPDKDYPWSFTGRLWFRPALVRVPTPDNNKPSPPPSVSILSLFGWTIGGVVALEYDDSPVGPYREYVTMGALVSKRGAIGQWGSRLYVSSKEAEEVCREIWKVPAEEANIQFLEGDSLSSLRVYSPPDSASSTRQKRLEQITVDGWENTRILKGTSVDDELTRNPSRGIPVLWTPSIKALWAPFIPLPPLDEKEHDLPLHRLRLSASAIGLCSCGQESSELLGVPLGIGLVVDNVLIEIAPNDGDL